MQTVSTPSTPSKWAQVIAGMPRPDPEDKILKNVQEGQVEKIVEELAAGGREAVVALVDMLAEPGAGATDSPARHALHALVIRSGARGDDARRATAAALASTLGGRERSANVRSFVLQELRYCGGAEVAPVIGKLLADEQVSADAAMALLAIRDGAADQFRAALSDLTGPQRVAAIVALGTLQDRESVDALRETATRDPDPVAQLQACHALARMGDEGAADAVLRLADDARGFDRTRATDACLLLAENLTAAGRSEAAAKIYRHLRDTRTGEDERYVTQIAERALRQ